MRDCIFLVADSTIKAMLTGFLAREGFHQSLGCRRFGFDPSKDVVVEPGRDPGVYTRGHELLSGFAATHARAVVILDAEWDGSPGAEQIQKKIGADLAPTWPDHLVVVLDPEIEAWIWQDNPHVAGALGASDYGELRAMIEKQGFWEADELKPRRPKEAVEFALKQARIPRSASLYGQLAGKVSTKACEDPAFDLLRAGLRGWFAVPT